MKVCIDCKFEKSYDEFHKHRDSHQSRCKDCGNRRNREWYQNNKQRTAVRVRRNNEKYVQAGRDWVCKYLDEHPCVDCGESNIIVLQFDHIKGTKVAHVSTMLTKLVKLDKVQEEIDKCEVVCANCHFKRTAARARTYRWKHINGGEA